MSTMFEAIFAVFLIGVTFIVLNHLPPLLDALIERVRPQEVAVAQPEDDDTANTDDDEKKLISARGGDRPTPPRDQDVRGRSTGMDFDAFAAVAATVGVLTCGCPFDRDGLHRPGEWVQCRFHRAPAPVANRITAATAGAVLGSSDLRTS